MVWLLRGRTCFYFSGKSLPLSLIEWRSTCTVGTEVSVWASHWCTCCGIYESNLAPWPSAQSSERLCRSRSSKSYLETRYRCPPSRAPHSGRRCRNLWCLWSALGIAEAPHLLPNSIDLRPFHPRNLSRLVRHDDSAGDGVAKHLFHDATNDDVKAVRRWKCFL